MDNTKELFIKFVETNVNEHVEKKPTNGGKELTYLSWAWAWDYFKRTYPDAQYSIYHDPSTNAPYTYDENLGYMVYTTVTAGGLTYEMWLPVMDGNNKAMKSHSYKYTTKYGEKTIEAATMFDINKTIMRCLVKNLAMFGLGLYIYAGEDLPTTEDDTTEKQDSKKAEPKKATPKKEVSEPKTDSTNDFAIRMEYINTLTKAKFDLTTVAQFFKKETINDVSAEELKQACIMKGLINE